MDQYQLQQLPEKKGVEGPFPKEIIKKLSIRQLELAGVAAIIQVHIV